jgi:type II secretory pathway pseudopilin PulG
MIVVVILGVLAAIAIPVFIRYVRSSKTSEAKQNMAYLFRESGVYFAASGDMPKQGVDGELLTPCFPVSDGPNPAVPPAGMKTLSTWDSETWKALKFAIPDRHYYSYTYASEGVYKTAQLTARAEGDLDGDGKKSLFERAGAVNSNLEVVGSTGLYENNPLE